jgi:hypothetical protein
MMKRLKSRRQDQCMILKRRLTAIEKLAATMSEIWNYPGARWWKFDFHTHTPASKDTAGWQKAIGKPDEVTPETWLLKVMAAGIDCVAVTDHNSGDWIDKLKLAYERMKHAAPAGFRELHLFPGVEISVQGGFHLLAIFAPVASSQTISDLLAQVGYDSTRGDSDGVTRDGGAEVIEKVVAAGGIPIAAHVDGDKGLLQCKPGTGQCQLDANTVKQVLQAPGLLALEWRDPAAQKPVVLVELKRDFTSVIGSDCHSFQGSAIPGSRYTWIKMEAPSLEGLRLALLDGQEVSVRRSDDAGNFSPFNKPEHFIESIEVSKSQVMGLGKQPALLQMSPYFNAVVGGRGTGKSTIVHALRLALRRNSELPRESEAWRIFDHFVAPAKGQKGGLRTETKIAVQVSRDGISHRLLWQPDGQGDVVQEWDEASQSFKSSVSQTINATRFPIRLFSQGQIAALAGDNQQALLKVIDDAAGTGAKQAAFEESKTAFFATCAQSRELDGKLQARDKLNIDLEDVQRKLARLASVNHVAVLKNHHRASDQSRELNRQFEHSYALFVRLQDFAPKLQLEDLPDGLFDQPVDVLALETVSKLQAAIAQARGAVEKAASDLVDQCIAIQSGVKDGEHWTTKADQARAAFEKMNADLHQVGVSEYGSFRLAQEKHQLETDIKRLDALQKERDSLQEKAHVQLAEVKAARRAISTCREEFIHTTLKDNPYVRLRLIPYSRDADAIKRSLRDLLGLDEGKFDDDLSAEADDAAQTKGAIAELLRGSKQPDKQSGEGDTSAFEAHVQTLKQRLSLACRGEGDFSAWFKKNLKAQADKQPSFIDHIQSWFPEDGLQVEYSRKGDGHDFESIAQASAGQRAAAMLAFLLAHGSEPLVLDQPEDDLDNHLIYDLVVQQIRANKLRRQLIIVTHNPNIVVNGDAELIHVLDFNNQCFVKQTGSLQDLAMRREVCQVMEGGKVAFERRYQRLGKEV